MKLGRKLRRLATLRQMSHVTAATSCQTRAMVDALEQRVLLSALSNSSWTPIGPAPIANSAIAGGEAVSGRVTGIAGDPTNANTVYLSSSAGGVWKTTDGGSTWAPLTDGQTTLFMSAIAVAPTSPNTIYAASGDPSGQSWSFYGRGVLKSTDGGATWTLLGNSVFNRRTITQIVVDPTNANTVYLSVNGGGSNGTGGNTGVWKSTDGGNTWTNTTASVNSGPWQDVEIDPANPQKLLASVESTSSASSSGGVYETLNGGTSWSLITALPNGNPAGNTRIAFAPSNDQVIYVSSVSFLNLGSMWVSTNGGTTWTQLTNTPNYLGSQAFYDSTLAVDPSNPDIVYAGGANQILQTTDAGQHWTDITTGSAGNNATGIDHHALAFDAAGHLLDGNDNGIWMLDNATPGSIHWNDLNSNLSITQFFGGSIDFSNPGHAVGGTLANGAVEFSGSAAWSQSLTGDVGKVFIDQQDPSRVYLQQPDTVHGLNNFLLRSDDGGQTWTPIINGINTDEPQNYFPYLAVDPSNGNHLLYSTDRVYESTDGGDHWMPISTPFSNGWTQSAPINLVAIAPSDPNTVYAAVGGLIIVTTNGGASWAQHTAPSTSPFGQILIDPGNAQIVYATGDSFGGNHLSRSIDGGLTWENLTGNMPDLPVYSIAVVGATLFIGSDNGVWASSDDGTTWSKYASGMPNTEVRELSYDPTHNILAAFTLGRGAWEISLAPTPPPLIVNTTGDETTSGDGLLSLREAIAAANSTGQGIGFDPSLDGQTVTLDPADGPITISGSVSVAGPGAGSLTVSDSTSALLEVQSGGVLHLSNVSLSGAGTALQTDASGQAILQAVLASGGITDNGTLTFNEFVDNNCAAAITGTGSLTKNGPATLTLGAANSYTGGTTIRSGALAGDTNALGRSISVSPGAYLEFNQLDITGTQGAFGGTVTGAGAVRLSGAGSVVQLGTWGSSTNSTLANTGPTIIDPGATLIAGSTGELGAASIYTVNGNLNLGGFSQSIGGLAGAATGAVYNQSAQPNPLATLTVNNSANTTYAGVIEDVPTGGSTGRLALVKSASGSLILDGTSPNTYTGGTTLSVGTIQGNSQTLEGAITDNSSLTVDQSLGAIVAGTMSVNITGTGSLLIMPGTVHLASGSTLANVNATTVNGTLVAPPTSNALSASSPYTISASLDLNGFDQTIGSLAGNGTIFNGASGTATIVSGGLNTNTTFSGVLEDHPAGSGSGILALRKVGSGVLTLDGANTCSGAMVVAGGTIGAGPSGGDPFGAGAVDLQSAAVSLADLMTTPQQEIIAATGYNQDVIAEAAASDPSTATSIPFDGVSPNATVNNVFYEQGFGNSAAQGTGLPAGDTPIVSPINPGVSFQLQPYTANNVAFMPSLNSSVTLTLVSPASFRTLNILATASDGGGNVSARLNFADGSSSTLPMSVPDWFNNPNAVYIAGGRVLRASGVTPTVTPNEVRLYEFDFILAAADQTRTLNSITFTLTSGSIAEAGIFALSGATWSPQSVQTYPNAIYNSGSGAINLQTPIVETFPSLTANSDSSQIAVNGVSGSTLSFQQVTLLNNLSFAQATGTTVTLGPVSDNGAGFGVGNTGSGTLILNGPNSYGGITSTTGGTLIVESASAIPANTEIWASVTGTLLLQPSNPPFMIDVSFIWNYSGGKIDIGNNGILINYSAGNDPVGDIRTFLTNGYNGGGWNTGFGAPGSYGSIVSSSAANDPQHRTAIGYADWADGQGVNTTPNSVEIKYTLYGDANLDGQVNSADLQILLFGLNRPGLWDQGDFNYDQQVNSADLQALLFTLNTSLANQAAPVASQQTAPLGSPPTSAASDSSRKLLPSLRGNSASARQVIPATRRTRKHR